MPVGSQANTDTINSRISQFATQMRDLMQQVVNLSMSVNGQNAGLAYLESVGFSSTANSANPGGVSDAQYALNMINYMNTVASVYFGGAAQTPPFNFNQELSQMWAAG
jgi:hypothetical protein